LSTTISHYKSESQLLLLFNGAVMKSLSDALSSCVDSCPKVEILQAAVIFLQRFLDVKFPRRFLANFFLNLSVFH